MAAISATELARNTRDILDRVLQSGETVAILRNNVAIAQIAPATKTMTAEQALANFEIAPMSHEQGAAWLKASRHEFDEGVRNPWA